VCPDKKLIFVHIYKTSGSTITRTLAKQTRILRASQEIRFDRNGWQGLWHFNGRQYSTFDESREELEKCGINYLNYTIFTVCRNPYIWFLSTYNNFFRPKPKRRSGPRALRKAVPKADVG